MEKERKRSQDYKLKNKDQIKKKRNERVRNRRKEDPSFRIRDNVSRMIRKALKKNFGSKKGFSFLKYLNYTMTELKNHLEGLFEPWMNWNNSGYYSPKKWDDNDSATWTWQIDHITPQSILVYSSMEDTNFKKCWALDNLRPLSAKENFLKGNK